MFRLLHKKDKVQKSAPSLTDDIKMVISQCEVMVKSGEMSMNEFLAYKRELSKNIL